MKPFEDCNYIATNEITTKCNTSTISYIKNGKQLNGPELHPKPLHEVASHN